MFSGMNPPLSTLKMWFIFCLICRVCVCMCVAPNWSGKVSDFAPLHLEKNCAPEEFKSSHFGYVNRHSKVLLNALGLDERRLIFKGPASEVHHPFREGCHHKFHLFHTYFINSPMCI